MSDIKAYVGDLATVQDVARFQTVLSKKPAKAWVKSHPFAKNVNYIAISTVEALMDSLFPEHNYEIREVKQLFNSVMVSVRVHYKHPVNGEWFYVDGVGAQNIQMDAGATANDLSKIKANAVMLAAPAAESYAIKDACEKLGNIFGRNINRKDVVELPSAYLNKEVERVRAMLGKCQSLDDIGLLQSNIESQEAMTEQIKDLINEHKDRF